MCYFVQLRIDLLKLFFDCLSCILTSLFLLIRYVTMDTILSMVKTYVHLTIDYFWQQLQGGLLREWKWRSKNEYIVSFYNLLYSN